MANVTVKYDDLESTAGVLESINDKYITSVRSELEQIKSDFESENRNHDNCFADVLNFIDDLEHAFENYSKEVNFLVEQCKHASDVFKAAEGEDASSSALTDRDQYIQQMAGMLGMVDENGKYAADDGRVARSEIQNDLCQGKERDGTEREQNAQNA